MQTRPDQRPGNAELAAPFDAAREGRLSAVAVGGLVFTPEDGRPLGPDWVYNALTQRQLRNLWMKRLHKQEATSCERAAARHVANDEYR